ncbi:MAG TPA: peptidase S41 [Candidatus Taylorbacteria bacterium]|nr:MAG: Carboxyl-terminal protease [Parcubacteria group bacterium GW2011_GWA2_47_64]KKU97109.1 MAG: Carboxyl-terminal protease [Parcubacteria group bacterium GW2011_GWC2_48_17]HBV01560.1 peptidase S41 [Candidatus Taylorbacteria bacterium]
MKPTDRKKAPSIILATLLLTGVFYIGFTFGEGHQSAIEKAATLYGKESPPGLLDMTDFSPFWSAWNVLNEKYVPATTTAVASDEQKLWGAIEGLTASLKDPYTVFFPPEESKLFESEINGSFEGIGMEIGIKDDVLTVIAPLKGTPAERAGILPGDKILKINDEASASLRVDQAVKLIRGKKGTEVRLTVLREGRPDSFEIKVIRDVIDLPTIDVELKPGKIVGGENAGKESGLTKDGVYIIRLYNFSATSPRLFRDALRKFVESGSNKLLLDLRGNPGGFLEAAVDIASWFLPAGKTVVTEDGGAKSAVKVHRSRGYNVFNNNLRMAILVNSGSASASEILAGALREHGIATLVGTKTFGKGSVQELVKLTPDTSLKVTVARWFTPNGLSISDGGLAPDVEVKLTPEDIEKKKDPQTDKAVELLTKP